MAIWGCETLPKELRTYKDVQGTQRNTYHNLVSQDFTRIWNWHTRGEKGGALIKGIEGEVHQEPELLTWGRGREIAGEITAGKRDRRQGWQTARAQRQTGSREEKWSLASGSGRERFFKNRVWAHRTVYSACPVHTGQRTGKKDFERAAAGAPDIAQCSVRCTPDCPVSPDRGKIWNFLNFSI
jgi:hypothetical protein